MSAGWFATCRPVIGPRYWVALLLASIAGADLGDVLAGPLGLGYWRGLPVLAVLFALTMLGARRWRRSQAWYWIAILIVRTAATNLSDEQTLALNVPFPVVVLAFLVLLAILVAAGVRTFDDGLPATDSVFWTAMLVAGTLGTACGDDLAFVQNLGPTTASAIMTVVLAAALWWRAVSRLPAIATFWGVVIVVRWWGTTVGDMTADHWGLFAGLATSVALMAGLLVIWPTSRLSAPWAV